MDANIRQHWTQLRVSPQLPVSLLCWLCACCVLLLLCVTAIFTLLCVSGVAGIAALFALTVSLSFSLTLLLSLCMLHFLSH